MAIAARILDTPRPGWPERARPAAQAPPLALDQRRLLVLLANGSSVDEAARRLHLSRRTAHRRLALARALLGARTTAHAAALVAVAEPADRDGLALLTRRERSILELVSEGLTSCEIGRRLGVERSTVDTLVAAGVAKLGARTRIQAAVRVAAWGPRVGANSG